MYFSGVTLDILLRRPSTGQKRQLHQLKSFLNDR